MYAVIQTGGKQYRVAPDDIIEVEKLEGKEGDSIKLEDVLMVGDNGKATLGTPAVKGASVEAEIIKQKKADKVLVFKMKRRQGYRRTQGHRHQLTVLKIKNIKKG